MNFGDFFKAASGHSQGPFDYQARLAGDAECRSRLIQVPTGLGKTAAVVMAWLWNRVALNRPDWPRRLVYCLPMRTLVEQTQQEIEQWLRNLNGRAEELGLEAEARQALQWLLEHSPVVLMGGEELEAEKAAWDLYPERPCILIGTQDMLLSRALNRGYGMSRYRWPMHFGLLNNDALWVMDEIQLMGVGVETSAQLDAFRQAPTATGAFTWWMSATLDTLQLETVDHAEPPSGWLVLKLDDADLALSTVRARIAANKPLAQASIRLEAASKKNYAKELAGFVREKHQPDTLTLVVLNRVARAQQVYEHLLETGIPAGELTLIHSRFRPEERCKHQELLRRAGNRIVVATQAVEAGVDISACTLVSELAPWASLVQRFGRCNRRGEFASEANVFWVDLVAREETDELALPYSASELSIARETLVKLDNASPHRLEQISVSPQRIIRPVLRRKDLMELFDTTPDLCGNDLDISRYIRDGEDHDVQVYWRELKGEQPSADLAVPSREELCRVSISEFGRFLAQKSKPAAYVWKPLEEKWQRSTRVRPGTVYLLDRETGGYSAELGWTGDTKDKPQVLPIAGAEIEGYSRNGLTFIRKWIELRQHTTDVVEEMAQLSTALGLDATFTAALRTSALWHDVGKAHEEFQKMLRQNGTPPRPEGVWAKAGQWSGVHPRKGFRHELASALAWLTAGPTDVAERNLIAYLIASHHGRVRLSIRALPEETAPPEDPERLYARGIWDGEQLPSLVLDGVTIPAVFLDLSLMRMGEGPRGPSWLARMNSLRDRIGLFTLAYLETLLRAADARASAAETMERTQL